MGANTVGVAADFSSRSSNVFEEARVYSTESTRDYEAVVWLVPRCFSQRDQQKGRIAYPSRRVTIVSWLTYMTSRE